MSDKQINKEFWQEFDETITQTFVPPFSTDTIRPCAEEDFQGFKRTLKDNLHRLVLLMDIIPQNEDQWNIEIKKILMKVIIIIGEQNSKNPWNTSEIVELSKLMIPKICRIFKSENITETLKDDDMFLSVIMILRPKLLKDSWKSYPASVICYKWLLKSVEKPLLKRHVTEVLPTALIILDDYVHQNQIIGLQCINLIIEHCHKSRSLRSLNYDEVIFQALMKMARIIEPNMIILVYSCISNLLENIQYCDANSNLFEWNKRDEVLAILLNDMELQTNPQCRYAYVISLTKLLTHSASGKWSERLGRILGEYCEDDSDLKITGASLKLVKTFLSIYQPKGFTFYSTMYISLLKLRCNLITSEKDVKTIITEVDECFTLLNKLCPNLNKEILVDDTIKSVMNVT